MAELSAARSKASRIRFSADVSDSELDRATVDFVVERALLYQDAIEISPLLTPKLWDHLCIACERLELPKRSVLPFIYSSRDIQAECCAGVDQQCVLRFSSGLVDLLDEQEFEFVIGHELGHFLLDHHITNVGLDRVSPEYFRQRRYQEISSDRLGLIACGSLNAALRALMKTVSGLTGRHLRFDVGAFVAQLRKIDGSNPDFSHFTHPSIVIRARALLWFSLSEYFQAMHHLPTTEGLKRIDERIERDLCRYVDGAFRDRIAKASDELLLWMFTLEMTQSGAFSRSAQEVARNRFGEDTAQRLRHFLSELSKNEADAIIFEKLKSARTGLEVLIPRGFMERLRVLEEESKQLLARVSFV